MKKLDLVGHRFNHLTVIKKSDKKRKGSTLWECRCDCGNTILLEPYKIRRELVQSCGCSRKMKNMKDLSGKKIGRLTVLERLDKKKGSCYLWKCRCDCGNVIELPTNKLSGKHAQKSCGCVKFGHQVDLTGQKFGKLTAIEPLEKRNHGSVVWRCICDCGNEVEVAENMLVSKNTRSCGCLHQEKDSFSTYLNYIDDTCVESLRSKHLRKDNTSGCTGVRFQKGKWIAQINFQKIKYYLGSFDSLDDAIRVRKQAEHLLHDGFVACFDEWEKKLEKIRITKKSIHYILRLKTSSHVLATNNRMLTFVIEKLFEV